MTLIARTATYNGAPDRPQKWEETYRRPDGSTFTICFRRDRHDSHTDLVSMRLAEPRRWWLRRAWVYPAAAGEAT